MAAILAHKGPSRQVQGGTSNKAATRSRTYEGRSISPRGSNPPIAQPNKQIVGNYQLQRKLGVGTFGEVRLAIHLPTGQWTLYSCFRAFVSSRQIKDFVTEAFIGMDYMS
jgi:serine/threonine protein kinase